MSILNTLTEGIVNRDMAKEGEALLNKWSQTGLLEGLQTERQQHGMARLLENQAKELLREASTMATGDVEGFAAVAFPIVRRVFAGLIANDLVSVQPMSLPSGLIFFLDFTFELDSIGGSPRMGNTDNLSIYGTNQKGSEIISGVDLINATTKAGFSGPGRDGSTGYAYASPSGSNDATFTDDANNKTTVFKLDGSVSDARRKLIQYDPDLLSLTGTEKGVVVVEIKKSQMTSADGNPDFDNLSPMLLTIAAADVTGLGGVTALAQIRRLTTKVAAADAFSGFESIRFVYTVAQSDVTEQAAASNNLAVAVGIGDCSYPLKDVYNTAGTDAVGGVVGDLFALENSSDIPEINIKVDSTAITAQTKKLKAKWTPELGQDLNAYHNLDAEVELTSILSEQIALEIDREILADLVNGATAGTMYWSRSPGLFVNRSTGAELGASSAAPDFTGTVSEWYETLIETINDVSAQIHRKTLRGGANFVVCSPEVANILEFTAGFRANVTADADKGEIGANKVGSLSRKFDVIVDPYFPRNVVLVGRKGSSFLESGYVYAPYVPLQVTPTIFGVEDFVPRKGVMTRYAKKMVRPDMYGIVIVRGLMGEEYAP
tara:strand:- start:966 stop:2777 length:1812 start_codon:yes stop_codon:yes gene_type:complete